MSSYPKSLLSQLLPPLVSILVVLLLSAGVLLWHAHQQRLHEYSQYHLNDRRLELQKSLHYQANGIGSTLRIISSDTRMHDALAASDRDQLLQDWQGVFADLRQGSDITHLYFFDPERICLLRVHNPDKYGDQIDRFTALKAQQTQTTAWGLEIGPLGTFTLRVVEPVFAENTNILLGYVELGREIEDVLALTHIKPGDEIGLFINKRYITQNRFETGMQRLGRDVSWNLFADYAAIYSSASDVMDIFGKLIQDNDVNYTLTPYDDFGQRMHLLHADFYTDTDKGVYTTVSLAERYWQILISPLTDASSTHIGFLLLMHDYTQAREQFRVQLLMFAGGGLLILALLLAFVFLLLRRTDQHIHTQNEELEQSEALLCRSQEIAHVGSWELNLTTQKLTWSDEIFRIFGLQPKVFAPSYEAFLDAIHPHDREKVNRAYQKSLEDGAEYEIEHRIIRADNGEIRYVYEKCQHTVDTHGKITGSVGMVQDITERKQAELNLQNTEISLRAILDATDEGIMVLDFKGNVLFYNDRFTKLWRISKLRLDNEPSASLLIYASRQLKHPSAFLRRVRSVHNLETQNLEVFYFRDGRVYEGFSCSMNLQGRRLGKAWSFRDITQRHRTEEALLRNNRQLEAAVTRANELATKAEQANVAKSHFLANMSHEIRTPMNGVIGMIGLLLDTQLNTEQRRYAEIVHASADSLLTLINDILDFSKIEAQRLDLETLDFNLLDLLEDFAATLAVRAYEKNLEFLCFADTNVPTLVCGDPGRLRQILTNLVSNAIKFTHQGEVVVRVFLMSQTDKDCVLHFSVRDTGIGIPEDKLDILFEKFTQVDASTTREYGGTGLGLAISKQLVELMGGEIGVHSQPMSGSTFWFTVSLGKQDLAQELLQPQGNPDLQDVRVLIVDDNATNREILTTRLDLWGMRVDEYADGPSALAALKQAATQGDPFRIAIIDMQMPGMDGETLGVLIKAEKTLTPLKTIMLTSIGMQGDAHRFEQAGFSAYITKPLRHLELFNVLSDLIAEGTQTRARRIMTRQSKPTTDKLFFDIPARILLAEDNITNQKVAVSILKKLGLKADTVADGAEVITALKTIPYDLVLMDVQMPVMDGLDATRAIRDPNTPVFNHDIPIIAMTAHAMQGDRERCLQAGMNDYVPKPVNAEKLAEVLKQWLPQKEKDPNVVHTTKDPIEADTKEADTKEADTKEAEAITKANVEDHATQDLQPIFDQQDLMLRMMEDAQLARWVIQDFLHDTPAEIETLIDYFNSDNLKDIKRQAHSIKGASANVGGKRLQDVAFTMEQAALAGHLDEARALLKPLSAEFNALQKVLRQALSSCYDDPS